jgi:hypothetical protein
MKLFFIFLTPFLCSFCPALAQGTIVFNNLAPNLGKVFFSTRPPDFTLLAQDLNFQLTVYPLDGGNLRFDRVALKRRDGEWHQRWAGLIRGSESQPHCSAGSPARGSSTRRD